MHERRGFGIALSTTLVGVGFGAFLAYYIAMAALAPSRRGDYGWVPVLALAMVGVAFAVGVAVFVSLYRESTRRRALGAFAKRGRELGVNYQNQVGERQAVQDWIDETRTWLDTNLPDYAELFSTPVLGRMPPQDLNNVVSDEVRAVILSHLQRLAEIMIKL